MQYVGLATATRGNALAETGINLDSFSCRYYPQFKEYLNDYQGIKRCFALPDKLDRELNVQGEALSGGTGLMAVKFVTAITLANSTTDFEAVNAGGNSGGFYADEITIASSRDGWKTFNMRASASPNIA